MKYWSDMTKKLYESEKELAQAEAAVMIEQERAEAARRKEKERKAEELKKVAEKQKELSEQRKARVEEVAEARKAMEAAQKNYREVLAKFCKDYGAYHCTVNSADEFPQLLRSLFDLF